MTLKSYHQAWLSNHPERDEDWLRERLREGFDVHHIDGDHQNDDPGNLALIDHADHMRVHNRGGLRIAWTAAKSDRRREADDDLGARVAALWIAGAGWREMERTLGCKAAKIDRLRRIYVPQHLHTRRPWR